jgi:hypothetical protein
MRATRAVTGAAMPSTCKVALRPISSAATSSGAIAASSSRRDRSTISISFASIATRSPGCTMRCATRPLIGAVSTESARALRASSTAACAEPSVARAPASVEIEVSSAVGEMKPCATSARLFSSARCAISSWARVDDAVWSAWRSFQSSSAVSSRPRTWPALTASPSRTVSCFTSAATLARTTALLTAFSPPEMSSVRGRSSRRATTTSFGARSRPVAGFAAVARACSARRASIARPTKRPTTASATTGSSHFQPALHRVRPEWGRGPWHSMAVRGRRRFATRGLQAVQHQIDLRLDHPLRIEHAADRAGAERMLVHDQEQQRGHQRMDHVGDDDRPELAAVDAALHQLGEHRVRGLDDLVDIELGDVREVARLGHHQLQDAGGAGLAHPLPPEPKHPREQLGGGAVEVADQVDALDDPVDDVLAHDLLQQVFLARVVQVQRALRDAGPGRHFLRARRGEPLLDEQVERGIEQFLRTRFLAALATRGGCAEAAAERRTAAGMILTDWSVMVSQPAARVKAGTVVAVGVP